MLTSFAAKPPFDPDENTPYNSNEPYFDLIDYLLNMNDIDLPSVLTTSYGDDEQSVPRVYAERVCRVGYIFQELCVAMTDINQGLCRSGCTVICLTACYVLPFAYLSCPPQWHFCYLQ